VRGINIQLLFIEKRNLSYSIACPKLLPLLQLQADVSIMLQELEITREYLFSGRVCSDYFDRKD
jgi:hypothetical protein